MHPLQKIISKQKSGNHAGIYSACTANNYALMAVLERAKKHETYALIEATANQVDHNGGYTGMTPVDFKNYVLGLAKSIGFPLDKLILGGDHLGPLTVSNKNEDEAMQYARELVRAYVLAGFTKIHLDTSMRLADDDKASPLSDSTIARRGAQLCAVAEEAFRELKSAQPDSIPPVYIIGSEVPIPGGSQTEEAVSVTSPQDCAKTLEAFKSSFAQLGLEDAWSRVVGLVVQPGVEFGDSEICEYDREKARELTASLHSVQNLVFEGHSTDYQTPEKLREMVEDGIAILKVGPGLTFAMREGLFALEMMEKELFKGTQKSTSDLRNVLEKAMLENPGNWKKHYHGTDRELAFARAFSFSDRARYYIPGDDVQKSINTLIENLCSANIPLTLISQFMPMQYNALRAGKIKNNPEELLKDRIGNTIDEYLYATL